MVTVKLSNENFPMSVYKNLIQHLLSNNSFDNFARSKGMYTLY